MFVPAGTPHAIGEGILMVELQEPTDFSILLETPAGTESSAELHLGWDLALEAVGREALHERQLQSMLSGPRELRRGVSTLLREAAAPYFRRSGSRPIRLPTSTPVIRFSWQWTERESSSWPAGRASCTAATRS